MDNVAVGEYVALSLWAESFFGENYPMISLLAFVFDWQKGHKQLTLGGVSFPRSPVHQVHARLLEVDAQFDTNRWCYALEVCGKRWQWKGHP